MRDPRVLRVLRCGRVTVQDAGRPGYAAIGVGRSGAADRASYELANRLLGNAEGAATLEVTLGGLEIEVNATVWLVVTGAPAPIEIDGRDEPAGVVLALHPGQRLRMGTPPTGLVSYLAVRGGVATPVVLGSRSDDSLSGIGRTPVQESARLPIGVPPATDLLVDGLPCPGYAPTPVLAVLRGPHDDWCADPETLVTTTWRVGADSDRIGVRLEGGTLLRTDAQRQLPSEGTLRGAIQLPPDGRPVVFGPDHPVTGGYPVIGVVAEADTDRLAQLRPGETLRFRWREVAASGSQ